MFQSPISGSQTKTQLHYTQQHMIVSIPYKRVTNHKINNEILIFTNVSIPYKRVTNSLLFPAL